MIQEKAPFVIAAEPVYDVFAPAHHDPDGLEEVILVGGPKTVKDEHHDNANDNYSNLPCATPKKQSPMVER